MIDDCPGIIGPDEPLVATPPGRPLLDYLDGVVAVVWVFLTLALFVELLRFEPPSAEFCGAIVGWVVGSVTWALSLLYWREP